MLLSVAVLAMIASCASYDATKAPALSYDAQVQSAKVESNHIAVLVKPIQSKLEMEKYFGGDLLKYGILPIEVSITNLGHDGSMVFEPNGLNLTGPSNEHSTMLSLDQVYDRTKKSQWRTAGWAVGFGIFGLIPSAINVNNVNNKMRADYQEKMLSGGNIAKGEAKEGVAFFSVPQDLKSLDAWKLNIMVKDFTNQTNVTVDYPLTGAVEPRVAKN